ncbi:adhesion G-protein coupled receptor G6 [Trichonephila clavata]|uniref:Adhesion G-protein coupled receptor G6 n=1 Tax=Trichonephila clavata TaxID=2740835 RepID=A0A8X6LHV9_TRICU|nr:adhesion G-protein coupled receptor G6 [Trichonephila clavata]
MNRGFLENMSSVKKKQLWIILYLLYFLYPLTDTFVQKCDNISDNCQCHSTFVNYYYELKGQKNITKNCLKMFTRKLNWSDAEMTCKLEYSHLLNDRMDRSFFQEFESKGINLIWVGIKKMSGFYLSLSDQPSLYKESFREWGKKWDDEEPLYDCVALDISAGHLVTHPCSTELEFVCQNNGFPVYPVTETLACPDDWVFVYHLPVNRKKCIKGFKRNKIIDDATETCSDLGSTVADLEDYFSMYNYLSSLNITGYGEVENGTEACVTKIIQSLLGNSIKSNVRLDCTDKLFVCEQDSRNISLSAKILPEISESFLSSDGSKNHLTCDVSLNGKSMSGMVNMLHFMWFKNGIPIAMDSHLFQVGFYPDPIKVLLSPVTSQGTYKCGVLTEGLQDLILSPEVDYFYSDVSTYILTLQGNAKELKYQDFSKIAFRRFRSNLNQSMASFTRDITSLVPDVKWDFQESWYDGNNATIKMLLYIDRNESLFTVIQNETESYQILQKYFVERKLISEKWDKFSMKLQSGDVCFEENVPPFKSSYKDVLLWKDTIQTKSAVSEPLCLNGWRLVTRKCKPCISFGARWLPFNYSMCTSYQLSIKDLEPKCPEGFKPLEQNFCYAIHRTKHTLEEAEGICLNKSSFFMDLKILKNTRIFSELEFSKYWFSEKLGFMNFQTSVKKHIFGKFQLKSYLNLNNKNSSANCVSVNVLNGIPVYDFADCKDSDKLAFVCIHQPLELLESIIFSRSWYKFSHQNACYYIDYKKKTWTEANESCQNIPVKSNLLKSIRNVEDYTLFKVLLHTLTPVDKEYSWWINMLQDMDSLKWLSTPEQSMTYVDWAPHTNFYREKAGGVLTTNSVFKNRKIQWSLKDLSTKEKSICEMQNCIDNRPTLVYIEDRTLIDLSSTKDYLDAIVNFRLHCVPSGWFVADSMVWLKDGIPVLSEPNSNQLVLTVKPYADLENIFDFQGYYWCSVAQEKSVKRVFSPKILFRLPGLHTFVLYMKLKVPDNSTCSNELSLKLPLIYKLNQYIHKTLSFGDFLPLLLRNASCINSELHCYAHIHIQKEHGSEARVLDMIKTCINYENEEMVELLKGFQLNRKEVFVRSTVSCLSEKTYYSGYNITWPAISLGQTTLPEEVCITEEGYSLQRTCLGDFNTGAFWSSLEKNCAPVQSNLTLTLHRLSKTTITEDNILNSSLDMQNLTTTSGDISPADIQYVAQILKNMANVPSIEPKVLRSVVSTVDTVIDVELSDSNKRQISSIVSNKISAAVENIASNVQTNGQSIKESGKNIALSVDPLNSEVNLIPTGGVLECWNSNVTTLFNDSDEHVYDQFHTFEAAVILPENLLTLKQQENVTEMVIIVRKNINFVENVEVVSPIIDVSMGREPVYDVDPPVKMMFKVPEVSAMKRDFSLACVFWDRTLNNNRGDWSYKGCISNFIGSTLVQCFCDHLTSFAVILELKPGSEIHKVHADILSTITYIGCSLSIFGLGMIILTFILFRKWRKDSKHKMLFHLSLALICFLLLFLFGIMKKEPKYGCITIAVFLHYFMLASFAWMLVEAFMQYLSLVKVIGTYIPGLMQKAMLFGWGTPLLIVGITLGVNHHLYDSGGKYCWLADDVFYFAVAGPVLAMLVSNFVIFGLILYSNTCGRQTKYLRTNQNERQETMARAKAVFCVSVLLGLSWIFGFLAIDDAKLTFQYLFAITTTLQGFFIFVFFVLRQKSTRDLWLNLMTSSQTPEISRISHNTAGTEIASRLTHNGITPKNSTCHGIQNRISKVAFKARLSYISFQG